MTSRREFLKRFGLFAGGLALVGPRRALDALPEAEATGAAPAAVAVAPRTAIVASGGLCAPITPVYQRLVGNGILFADERITGAIPPFGGSA